MSRTKGAANKNRSFSTRAPREAQINFRCTLDQKELINRISIETGMSVADLILKAISSYSLTSYQVAIKAGIKPSELQPLQ